MLEILAAGINVIGALNIQHLESLKDVVEKATGVTIRETVPDRFLKEAVQVVNLDLAVEDLLERLQGGKIYAADKVALGARALLQGRQPDDAARARAARGRREPRAPERDQGAHRATATSARGRMRAVA